MGVWEDLSQFLESRLEEFLEKNPKLKLLVLMENIRQQEEEAQSKLQQTQTDIQRLQEEIMAVARDVQKWQGRIEQARASKRNDLAQAAKERSDELLRTGNQLWGQMTVLKQQAQQTQTLLDRIQVKRKELEIHMATQQEEESKRPNPTSYRSKSNDDLDKKFRDWEVEQELERLKRKK